MSHNTPAHTHTQHTQTDRHTHTLNPAGAHTHTHTQTDTHTHTQPTARAHTRAHMHQWLHAVLKCSPKRSVRAIWLCYGLADASSTPCCMNTCVCVCVCVCPFSFFYLMDAEPPFHILEVSRCVAARVLYMCSACTVAHMYTNTTVYKQMQYGGPLRGDQSHVCVCVGRPFRCCPPPIPCWTVLP